MKKWIAWMTIVFMLLAMLTASWVSASAPEQSVVANPEADEVISPVRQFVVSLKEEAGWREIGALQFNKYQQDKKLDLAGSVPQGEAVTIRIEQKGGGSAYIDSVFLGGKPPVKADGKDGFILKKLIESDFDVVHVDNDGIQLEFLCTGTEKQLIISGRIEEEVISKIPLQFPVENNYKVIDKDSAFYNYALNSIDGKLAVDGELDDMTGFNSLFREYCIPGSGHPEGYIYCWVMNDSENLYIALDVTPDNTYDGDKDYAKAYINTPYGVREFNMTTVETQWGLTGFTYTDNVKYQHKVYEFEIPLGEIGADKADGTENIQIAFSVYGTVAGSSLWIDPRECWLIEGETEEIEIIYYDAEFDAHVVTLDPALSMVSMDEEIAKIVKVNGKAYILGVREGETMIEVTYDPGTIDPFIEYVTVYVDEQPDIYRQNPSVAYDSHNNLYLSVYESYSNDGFLNYIYGQVVDENGMSIGLEFPINWDEIDLSSPVVAYDIRNKCFLVVWTEGTGENGLLIGQVVRLEKSGDEVYAVCEEYREWISDLNMQYLSELSIAYDSMNGKFLVVWNDSIGGSGDILGSFVKVSYNEDGDVEYWVEDPLLICQEDGEQINPAVEYTDNGRYLVAWEDTRDGNSHVYAQVLDAVSGEPATGFDGKPLVANGFPINSVDADVDGITYDEIMQSDPAVAVNRQGDTFLITWSDSRKGKSSIYGILVKSDGTLLGKEFIITDQEEYGYIYNQYPASSYDELNKVFLTAWQEQRPDISSYVELRFANDDGTLSGNEFYTDMDEDDRDETGGDDPTIAMANNSLLHNFLVAYNVPRFGTIGYRIIGYNAPPPPLPDPELRFVPDTYSVKIGEQAQAVVKLYNYGGEGDISVTDSVYYQSVNPEIVTVTPFGIILGVSEGTAMITATIELPALDFLDAGSETITLTATATVKVSEKPEEPPPPPAVILPPPRIPVGKILVDGEIVQTIYKEDVTATDGVYSFMTDVPGDSTILWLAADYYKELLNRTPENFVEFSGNATSVKIPLKCIDIESEIKALDSSANNSRVYFKMEKVKGRKVIARFRRNFMLMGGKLVDDIYDFKVMVEGEMGKNKEIQGFNYYVDYLVYGLSDVDPYNTTAFKILGDNSFTFAPSLFIEDSSKGVFARIKYRGSGRFAIVRNPQTFSDLTEYWAKEDIEKLASRQLVLSKNQLQFYSKEKITRAEFVVMLAKALGITEEKRDWNFYDVKDEWFADDVRTAAALGLLHWGNDGYFRPDLYIPREEMAALIIRAIKFAGININETNVRIVLPRFYDWLDIGKYARQDVAVCADASIILGNDRRYFAPGEYATRAEASAIIERMMRYIEFMN